MSGQESLEIEIKKELDDCEQYDNDGKNSFESMVVPDQHNNNTINGACKVENTYFEDEYIPDTSMQCGADITEVSSGDTEGINLLKYFKKSNELYEKTSDGNEFVCRVCGQKYDTLWRTRIHVRSHFESRSLFCEICCKRFLSSERFDNHRCVPKGAVLNGVVDNNIIKEVIAVEKKSSKNSRKHSNDMVNNSGDGRVDEREKGPHVCNICNKTLSGKKSLKLHMYQHSDEPPFVCNLCDKGFYLPNGLQSHMRVHNGDMFKCTYCTMEFSRTNQLKRHLRQHTGERPYVCKICYSSYTLLSTLKDHMRKHSGDLYECDSCGKKFTQAQNLKKHKQRVTCGPTNNHGTINPFGCQQCEKVFPSPSSYFSHVEEHSQCPKCKESFSSIEMFLVHFVRHRSSEETSMYCPVGSCSKQFDEMTKLERHIRNHYKRQPFICSVCRQKFTTSVKLRQHYEFHIGVKNILCPICGLAFERETSFQAHVRKQHEQNNLQLLDKAMQPEIPNQSEVNMEAAIPEDCSQLNTTVAKTIHEIGEFEKRPNLDIPTVEKEQESDMPTSYLERIYRTIQVKIEQDTDFDTSQVLHVPPPTGIVHVKLEPGVDSCTGNEKIQIKTEPDVDC